MCLCDHPVCPQGLLNLCKVRARVFALPGTHQQEAWVFPPSHWKDFWMIVFSTKYTYLLQHIWADTSSRKVFKHSPWKDLLIAWVFWHQCLDLDLELLQCDAMRSNHCHQAVGCPAGSWCQVVDPIFQPLECRCSFRNLLHRAWDVWSQRFRPLWHIQACQKAWGLEALGILCHSFHSCSRSTMSYQSETHPCHNIPRLDAVWVQMCQDVSQGAVLHEYMQRSHPLMAHHNAIFWSWCQSQLGPPWAMARHPHIHFGQDGLLGHWPPTSCSCMQGCCDLVKLAVSWLCFLVCQHTLQPCQVVGMSSLIHWRNSRQYVQALKVVHPSLEDHLLLHMDLSNAVNKPFFLCFILKKNIKKIYNLI